MVALLTRLFLPVRSRFKSRARLEAENLVLRQEVSLSRKPEARVRLRNLDRLLVGVALPLFPSVLDAVVIVTPGDCDPAA